MAPGTRFDINARTSEVCRVYEQGAVRGPTGDVLRPGGMKLTERALHRCGLAGRAKILDVGCGAGMTVEYLVNRGYDAVGVDPSEVLLAAGRRRNPSLALVGGRGEALPFADGAMDGIFAECTLSLMDDVDRALGEMHRVLRQDGWLVISDVYLRNPAGAAGLRLLPLHCCFTGALTREALWEKLKDRGFTPVLWEDHTPQLKEFTARLIWEHGSLAAFWGCVTAGQVQSAGVSEAVAAARPGYCLVLAQSAVP
ncbi:Ubiquinone/menaquinone biosynthesis C-methylase UbiE [Desulfotomaculum arcticum]|uniref:Ubiquinone/menaquinone biosynthesis C-methylase UbiE n=1 Tax=Desulfotruncus arcticus DSM 17038 TaxID=1121424 RepID=A0A1I2QS33_9FIRM|nr:class I SAM-dependent methyltransferase [Desulfotruncus arcticus]SFG30069.1 Ubiquinone/menaquinone biosynthesis C-methylase UbiE [Desulfotomaculum arcticum] [Desulfotruncus arcticus DSM 17038]